MTRWPPITYGHTGYDTAVVRGDLLRSHKARGGGGLQKMTPACTHIFSRKHDTKRWRSMRA